MYSYVKCCNEQASVDVPLVSTGIVSVQLVSISFLSLTLLHFARNKDSVPHCTVHAIESGLVLLLGFNGHEVLFVIEPIGFERECGLSGSGLTMDLNSGC